MESGKQTHGAGVLLVGEDEVHSLHHHGHRGQRAGRLHLSVELVRRREELHPLRSIQPRAQRLQLHGIAVLLLAVRKVHATEDRSVLLRQRSPADDPLQTLLARELTLLDAMQIKMKQHRQIQTLQDTLRHRIRLATLLQPLLHFRLLTGSQTEAIGHPVHREALYGQFLYPLATAHSALRRLEYKGLERHAHSKRRRIESTTRNQQRTSALSVFNSQMHSLHVHLDGIHQRRSERKGFRKIHDIDRGARFWWYRLGNVLLRYRRLLRFRFPFLQGDEGIHILHSDTNRVPVQRCPRNLQLTPAANHSHEFANYQSKHA